MVRKSTQQGVTAHSRNLEEKARRREQQAQKLLSRADFTMISSSLMLFWTSLYAEGKKSQPEIALNSSKSSEKLPRQKSSQ